MKRLLIAFGICLALIGTAQAEEKKKAAAAGGGIPPALVVVSDIKEGRVEPMSAYVGTVYYLRVSDVASEVAGLVEAVLIEEGQAVTKGQVLVELRTDLVENSIKATRASYAQARAELENARKNLERIKPLYQQESIAEVVYDEHYYKAAALEQRAVTLSASLERYELLKSKMIIRAPFTGVVLSRAAEVGQWVGQGGTVAVVADDTVVDAIVDVPEDVLAFLRLDQEINVKAGGKDITGRFIGYIPKGDEATRTFSVKVRFSNSTRLLEGMEARVMLPIAKSRSGMMVLRDAVINKYGQDVVFIVNDGKVRMVPVNVVGYSAMDAAIEGEGIEPGMKAVVKGNERIRQGQAVKVIGQK